MRQRIGAVTAVAVFLAVFTLALAAAGAFAARRAAPDSNGNGAPQSAAKLAFANAVTGPPPGWPGPVFELSDDYPAQNPGTCPPSVCTWLANKDVNFNVPISAPPPAWSEVWATYMQQLLDYIKEGQDPMLSNKAGWEVKVGDETRWFHVPWMAYDPSRGREFVHGLTNERTSSIQDFIGPEADVVKGRSTLPLAAGQDTSAGFETWAFGVYNPWGAWAIGQSWPADGRGRTTTYGADTIPAGLPFPQGTLVAKLLFSTADASDVPYLEGSPSWQADRHLLEKDIWKCERAPQPVQLVQLDVAVTDSRSPTGWVFGTFAYDGNMKVNGETPASPWDRLAPVGVQWGSDPWTFPAVPQADSIPAHESVLNRDIGIYQHFGCNGRLAGPVDNKLSSCFSCHGGGYAPPTGVAALPNTTPPIFGFEGICTNYSAANSFYFNNAPFPMAYSGGNFPNLMPMDTSLQMQVAFLQYGQFNEFGKPVPCTEAGLNPVPH
jgi:hypothetical protein